VTKQRRRKRSGLRTLLLFVLTPLIIWLLAFLLWFYWDDVGKLFRKDAARIPPAPKVIRKAEPPAKNPPEEKILEDDRRKLNEILKKKGA
jgi:hypothetical protein